ncbi:MAG: metallophosphoesterase family protein [Clostridiales bacterium]|nr:metallophosphoesterase family protein [Clostridiales bacterium]MBO4579298.1 metallophosphoesterase family protein [Clostridiales bacterium]
MKVLIVADTEDKRLYDFYRKDRTDGVELIVACGDLKSGYLDFLITMVNVPTIYICGNHDGNLIKEPVPGAECIENKVFKFKGYTFAGLGGSMRYNPDARNMYTENEMRWRAAKLAPKIALAGGLDVLVTHAPAKGYGDLDDLPHRGFETFNQIMNRYKPSYMFHGHVHTNYAMNVKTHMVHESGTQIYNAYGYQIIDLPDK